MNISQPIPSSVASIAFSFLTADEIRRISVKQIVNPVLLDDLNRPNPGGLYDPALGPSERSDICATCRQSSFSCPGHYGHIELPSPVFHPLFMNHMYNLLRATCLFCHHLKLARSVVLKYTAKFRLLEYGLLEAVGVIDALHVQSKKRTIDDDADDDDAEDDGDEPFAVFSQRISAFIQANLLKARQAGLKRDAYKDALVFQARKDLILDFQKTAMVKKCQHPQCGAHGYTFRKEGHTKIIEYDLTPKQRGIHNALGLKRPNVMRHLALSSSRVAKRQRVDSDSEMDDERDEDEDEEGEPTFSDDEADVHRADGAPRAANGMVKTSRGRNERIMAPEECRAHLRLLFKEEEELCSLIFGRHGPLSPVNAHGLSVASADMFFMEVLSVPPTRFRPPAKMGETLFEHAQNELLAKLLHTSYRLRDINSDLRAASAKSENYDDEARRKILGQLLEALVQLQVDVNSFIDSGKNPQPVRQGKLPPAGIKQGLEKKEGLFRKNMMGKRVNYAARSVISPDVNIEPNEIGVPPVFARKLTFPEPVSEHNYEALRAAIIRGPKDYPGASIVEYEDGHQVYLDKLSTEQRTAIANQLRAPHESGHSATGVTFPTRTPSVNKKVYRHLIDGDMLILNRQPTLHKPSMMAHRARVLQGEKTIRMHYANCNSYNADFDGDEMNIHFPQNAVARAEAMFIANTDNQYLVPTSGKPLRGLIQDHVVAGVWMTNKDTFFTREEYFQLLYGSLRPEDESGRLETLPPAIWKPRPLWTGKQIISTVLLNITPSHMEGLNLDASAKVPADVWGKWDSHLPNESNVIFRDGELLCGTLDKSAFGATDYGLVHSVYELYGADAAGRLLGILSRLFTKYLQMRAFTCRMDDLALTEAGNQKRRQILRAGEGLGTEGALENFPSLESTPEAERPDALVSLLRDVLRDDNKMAGLDMTVKTKLAKLTKSVADAVMPHGLLRKFPQNHMQTMTQSGAKGSGVNAQQISCLLGQQELEGRRVPVMISGKTLPAFKPFETKAIAGGYVASRFLTGIKPQEFFFHCMAGREGLIDTAVKTSRSGYLQRSLIKHLEGLRVHYDNTVRGSDNSVYQFFYGGDALDVTKQKHLYQFSFIAQNYTSMVNRYELITSLNGRDAVKYMKKVIKHRRTRHEYETAMAKFNPSLYLGATSEKFAEKFYQYLEQNQDGLVAPEKEDESKWQPQRRRPLPGQGVLKNLMWYKYLTSMVEPGEAVGLLAGQGVGEPSTQMTLNTFHFAGHGAANVTLGIPRLREIVMTASTKPKTPSMTMKMAVGLTEEDVDAFAKRASRLMLSQIVENVLVTERLSVNGMARSKAFKIAMKFFPEKEYRDEYDVSSLQILHAFSTRFPLILRREIMAEMKKLDADLKSQISELGKGRAPERGAASGGGEDRDDDAEPSGGAQDDADSEVGDGDATTEKRKRQAKELATYDSDEEGDDIGEMDDEALEAAYASDGSIVSEEPKPKKGKSAKLEAVAMVVEQSFRENFPATTGFKFGAGECVVELEFPTDFPKLLLVGIVEKACLKTVIREIPGIAECFRVREKQKDGSIKISTNGSNFKGMWQLARSDEIDMIDIDEIYSNDIYAILKAYGVEMARAAIVREMSSVFGVYKIDVNPRHLELIADYMTFEGGYKPFNRKGIGMHPSPLLKASFETTAAFISDATLYGDFDDLTTPSANVVIGRPSQCGTGAFDVVAPLGYERLQ